MSKEKETVAAIVAEMMDEGHIGDASFLEWVGAKILHYADRIEAAHSRENAHLRAALRPVLDVRNFTPAEFMNASEAMNAVREAQRIYNARESEVKK